jgi:hypothetical protein
MFEASLNKQGQLSSDVIHSVATGNYSQMGVIKGAQAAQALNNYLGHPAGASEGGGSAVGTQPTGHTAVAASPAIDTSPIETGTAPVGEDVITLNGGIAAGVQEAPGEMPTGTGTPASATDASGAPIQGTTSIPSKAPTFSDVEIGGGRITGYETPVGGGEAREFAMYNASQYMTPTGQYETVKTVDGESWYKQYAAPMVEKTPMEVTPKGVQYDEKIVMQMPPVPKRKDKV